MRSLWRSRKGSISILILLIYLLLAWMGAVTFTVMKTEQLKILYVDFNTDNTIDIHVQNTGTATITITDVRVNDAIIDVTDIVIDPGESYEVTGISCAWMSGTTYDIAVVTNTGARFIYRTTAP